jgi:GDP-4-dehydro-6-deoxy-D-mannose reductase
VYCMSMEPLTEDSPIGSAGPYSVSKLAQEMTADASPLPVLLVRPFNHAGPRQSPAYATSAFAQQVAEIEAGRREPILHVGNLEARRDITDVRDTVRAYEALAARGRPHVPYNVCSGRAYSMRDLLDILLSLSRVRVRVEVDPSRLRPSDTPMILGSHDRLTRDTGWQPEIRIEETLADLLDHWRRVTAEQRS